MRRLLACALAALALAACHDLTLPVAPPPPGPGTLQGNLVYAAPGRTTFEPAVGATVRIASSGVETVSISEGYFRLENIVGSDGTVLLQFDVDHDGAPDRQRRISLAEIGAGYGKHIALGQVVLGRNAAALGSATRSDLAGQNTGHAGTSVFVPEGPFATQTGDDGSFVLDNMPEGPLTLAFFRPGYESLVETTTLRAGERLTLQPVVLQKKLVADLPGTLSGRVTGIDGVGLAGVSVAAGAMGQVGESASDGTFSAMLPAGIYTVDFTRAGLAPLTLPNVLVASSTTSQVSVQTAQASFVAPPVSGAAMPLTFTVTATNDAGLLPAQQQQQVTVFVTDTIAPTIVADTAQSGSGSIFGITLFFSEDVTLAYDNSIYIADSNGGQVALARQLTPRQVRLEPAAPLIPGGTYSIVIGGGVSDLSTNAFPNSMPSGVYRVFTASMGLSMPFVSVEQSASPPFPGLLLKPQPPGTIQAFGRHKGATEDVPWLLKGQPAYSFNCTNVVGATCAVSTQGGGYAPNLQPNTGVPLRRSHVWGQTPLGVLQLAGISNATTTVLVTSDSNGVAIAPTGFDAGLEGPIGVAGKRLFTVGRTPTGDLNIREYDSFAQTTTLSTVDVSGLMADGGHIAIAGDDQRVTVVARSTDGLLALTNTASGWVWSDYMYPYPLHTPRVAPEVFSGSYGPSTEGIWLVDQPNGALIDTNPLGWQFAMNDPPTTLPQQGPSGPLSSFDLVRRGQLSLYAWVSSGILRVTLFGYGYLNSGSTLPGAYASPAGTMNADPACEAANPELVLIDDFLWLVWQEKCAGQQWKIVYRALH